MNTVIDTALAVIFTFAFTGLVMFYGLTLASWIERTLNALRIAITKVWSKG